MVYLPRDPAGYKNLLTWQQAGSIYHMTKDFVRKYLWGIDDKRLVNHLIDSGRSVQRNIEEGYKRATTKEYIEFLGFSRASLEELKGDFEELKREYKEGIRRENKGREGGYKGREGSDKGEKSYEGEMKKIERILDLIYGEDCMIGRQLYGLERKMVKDKTAPKADIIKKNWNTVMSKDKKFWETIKEKYGIIKDEKGFVRKK